VEDSEILLEADERLSQGYYFLAYAIVELLYKKVFGLAEFQEECEVYDCLENYTRIMTDYAEKAAACATESEKEKIYESLISLASDYGSDDFGSDFYSVLLAAAVKLITNDNKDLLLDFISENENSGYYCKDFLEVHLLVIKKLYGEPEAEKFINAHLEVNSFRISAYSKAIERKDYPFAEDLCTQALSRNTGYSRNSEWDYKLYDVYKLSENTPKEIEIAEKIFYQGDLKFYDIYKDMLTRQGVWKSEYQKVLDRSSKHLSPDMYMEILEKENEIERLLTAVKENPYAIFYYGKLLNDIYHADVCEIYTSVIDKKAEVTRKRHDYQEVCGDIKSFYNAGCPEALMLIENYKERFKKRPAFIEELGKIL
jgi:hypothetical protein